MRQYNEDGIIIKISDYAESDKILSILTKDSGRIDSIAKGVRGVKSRRASALELLNVGKFNFHEGKGLQVLTEVKIDLSFSNIDQDKIKFIFYNSEILEKSSRHHFDTKSIWEVLILTLNHLENFPELSTLKIQSIVLSEMGAMPEIHSCVVCGDELKGNYYISDSQIGILCENHKLGGDSVSERILKSIKFIQSINSDALFKLGLEESEKIFLLRIFNNWLEKSLESPINSVRVFPF